MPMDVLTLGTRLRYWRRVRGYESEKLAQLPRAAQQAMGLHGPPIMASWIPMRAGQEARCAWRWISPRRRWYRPQCGGPGGALRMPMA